MEDKTQNGNEVDVQGLIQKAIAEYVKQDSSRREPALKAELHEERRKREALERRLNQMAEENRKSREIAEQAERSSKIKGELQSLGVTKIDLAYRAIESDVQRSEDGRLIARTEAGEVGLREFLSQFVQDNPEFLPARIAGGSGVTAGPRSVSTSAPITLESISPTMSAEDKERVRQEILRVTSQEKRGF